MKKLLIATLALLLKTTNIIGMNNLQLKKFETDEETALKIEMRMREIEMNGGMNVTSKHFPNSLRSNTSNSDIIIIAPSNKVPLKKLFKGNLSPFHNPQKSIHLKLINSLNKK